MSLFVAPRIEHDQAQYAKLNRREERQIVLASTVGTLFEWYDFFLYGTLAAFISSVLFPPNNPTAALLAALAALAAGFIVRPLGALVFGHLGDRLGRKVTFVLTVVMMGGATVLMGCLPTYACAGNLSWMLLLVLRLVQGLAAGGEYGGAVVYVSEHAEPQRRGLLTSWIQVAGSLGLVLCLIVVAAMQASISAEAFKVWGWRVPFLGSVLLLAISIYVRTKLHESPVFAKMKQERRLSDSPLRDAFLKWASLRLILLALFGVTAGMGASYFTGQFYVMFFLQQAVLIDPIAVYKLVICGFLLGAPSYVFFGWLSDRIGRKWLIVGGLAMAAVCYRPMFNQLLELGNPALVSATQTNPVVIRANPDSAACAASFTAAVLGSHPDNTKACVQARKYLVSRGINFQYQAPLAGHDVAMSVANATVVDFKVGAYENALTAAGYPHRADPNAVHSVGIVAVLVAMTAVVAMVYGPVAAYLVELFPSQIRYTSLSFPYHIGAGVIGGSLPFFITYLAVASGNVTTGLWYPVVITAFVAVIGAMLLPRKGDSE